MLLAFALLFCWGSNGYANYELDPGFGNGGITRTSFRSGSNDLGYSLVINSEDRPVVAGSSDGNFAVARYKSDGKLDESFGTKGIVSTGFGPGVKYNYVYSLVIDRLGRLVAAGSSGDNFVLARYKSDGKLDESFGTKGVVTTNYGSGYHTWNAMVIDSQERIVVAGRTGNKKDSDFALARYTSDGKLDRTFGTKGIVTTDFGSGDDWGQSLAIDSQGRLIVAGYSNNGNDDDFALARYKSDGKLDRTFGTKGIVTTNFGSGNDYGDSLVIDSKGRLVVAGHSDGDFALACYTSDGKLDSTFGTKGIVTTVLGSVDDWAHSLAIDSRGRIVVAGYSNNGNDEDFALVRYTSDGKLDRTFGIKGIITTDFGFGDEGVRSLSIDSEGRLVVAGGSYNGSNWDFALARYKDIGK